METSVRTAMMAAYGLTGIDRKVLPLYQGQYDVRWLVMCMKKMLDTDQLTMKDLPEFNPFTLKKDIQSILNFVNATPTISWDDPELYKEFNCDDTIRLAQIGAKGRFRNETALKQNGRSV